MKEERGVVTRQSTHIRTEVRRLVIERAEKEQRRRERRSREREREQGGSRGGGGDRTKEREAVRKARANRSL